MYIIKLNSVNSTNNYARVLLEKVSVDDWTVVFTHNQRSGRGLEKNKWESQPDKNLTFSVILHPEFLSVSGQILLNMSISLAITDFVKDIDNALNVKIKWPNDIYINDSKLAGILIENIISGNVFKASIIGIGININQEAFSKNLPNPTSLKIESGRNFDIDMCLNKVLNNAVFYYNMLLNNLKKPIEDAYLNNLYRFGEYFSYILKGKVICAKIIGVSKFGKLVLEDKDNKIYECDLKEVEFVL